MRIKLLKPWGDTPAGAEVDTIDRLALHLINRKTAVAIVAAAVVEAAPPAPVAPAPERIAGQGKKKA